MRRVVGVPNVEQTLLGDLKFTFKFEDGTTEQFRCEPKHVSDFVFQLSVLNMGRIKQQQDFQPLRMDVSYEAGNGRVAIGIPSTDGTSMTLGMGHELAADLGNRLLQAAELSTKSPATKS